MRIKAATLAVLVIAMCAGCGWATTGAAGLVSPVNTAFTEIPGFTVTEVCPADVDPAFAGHEYDGLTAGVVSQNGDKILRVLAGQINSGDPMTAEGYTYAADRRVLIALTNILDNL